MFIELKHNYTNNNKTHPIVATFVSHVDVLPYRTYSPHHSSPTMVHVHLPCVLSSCASFSISSYYYFHLLTSFVSYLLMVYYYHQRVLYVHRPRRQLDLLQINIIISLTYKTLVNIASN
jgi:hypothetical protein